MRVVVAAFNQEKALVGAFSVIMNLRMEIFEALDRNVPLEKVHFLASTVSSKILNTIAKAEGVNFTETLTGFKHMGNQADILMKRGEVQCSSKYF